MISQRSGRESREDGGLGARLVGERVGEAAEVEGARGEDMLEGELGEADIAGVP